MYYSIRLTLNSGHDFSKKELDLTLDECKEEARLLMKRHPDASKAEISEHNPDDQAIRRVCWTCPPCPPGCRERRDYRWQYRTAPQASPSFTFSISPIPSPIVPSSFSSTNMSLATSLSVA